MRLRRGVARGMEYELCDSNGARTNIKLTLPDDLVPVAPTYRNLMTPWIALGRDGAAILMLWVPADAGENAATDTSVPITVRPTTITLARMKAAGLKPGSVKCDVLLGRLLLDMTASIDAAGRAN